MAAKSFDVSWLTDPKDERQLRQLSAEVDSLSGRQMLTAEEFEQLFGVFERFPDDDGYESFWQILHCLESFKGCEQFLVRSVRRRPCRFNITMVNRLLNSGISEVQGDPLVALLENVARSATKDPGVASLVKVFLNHQERQRSGA